MKIKFSRQIFEKKFQISNFIRIRPVAAELLHADGEADMMMLTVAFCNFANAPKNVVRTSRKTPNAFIRAIRFLTLCKTSQ
jgi:hypothetical protein